MKIFRAKVCILIIVSENFINFIYSIDFAPVVVNKTVIYILIYEKLDFRENFNKVFFLINLWTSYKKFLIYLFLFLFLCYKIRKTGIYELTFLKI